MKVIADTSFLVSLTNPRERQHSSCVQVARNLRHQLVIPVTVLPETTHLISRRISYEAMRAFVNQLLNPHWNIENLSANDLARTHEILRQYSDNHLDFTDGTIVALAERLDVKTILTLDQRDFRIIRPQHVDYFTLLP